MTSPLGSIHTTPVRVAKARLAQLVERQTFNLVVVGSSPTGGVYGFQKIPRRKIPILGLEPRSLG